MHSGAVEVRRGCWIPGTGVAGGHELLGHGLEAELQLLEEQLVLQPLSQLSSSSLASNTDSF